MLSIRIIGKRAVLTASIVIASAAGAAAQTPQADSAPGKPIQLVHVGEQPAKPVKVKSHIKAAAKVATRTAKPHHRHFAAKLAHPVPLAAEPAVTTVAAVPVKESSVDPALALGTPPAPLGAAVQVAAPGDVNDIDRAADTQDPQARKNVAAADAPAAVAAPAAVSAAAPAPVATPAAAPISASVSAALQDQGSNKQTNGTWLAEALAALGGAIAAASAAWFLIGANPQRLSTTSEV